MNDSDDIKIAYYTGLKDASKSILEAIDESISIEAIAIIVSITIRSANELIDEIEVKKNK